MNQNKKVRFTFVVPDNSQLFNIALNIDNCYAITTENFNKHYAEQVVVERAKEAS